MGPDPVPLSCVLNRVLNVVSPPGSGGTTIWNFPYAYGEVSHNEIALTCGFKKPARNPKKIYRNFALSVRFRHLQQENRLRVSTPKGSSGRPTPLRGGVTDWGCEQRACPWPCSCSSRVWLFGRQRLCGVAGATGKGGHSQRPWCWFWSHRLVAGVRTQQS